MAARTIVIASPVEPSGASWLLNCLLELGIKVRHRPVEKNVWRTKRGEMWVPGAGGHRLHPLAEPIKKWLPSLERATPFVFRDDVEVEYVQELPAVEAHDGTASAAAMPGAFFVRDPRDALYSAFRRQAPELDYDEFLSWPHAQTLLDRVGHWVLFARAWAEQPGVGVFRFEDYKADARATLEAALAHLGLGYPDAEVQRALDASTFEKARQAELRYQQRYPGDTEVANRAGRVGDWTSRTDLAAAAARIELRAARVLRRLGYDAATPGTAVVSPAPPSCNRCVSREALAKAEEDLLVHPARGDLLAFAGALDAELLRRSALPAHELRALVDRLGASVASRDPELATRLAAMRAPFADGAPYHLGQLRALVAARRPAERSSGER